MKVVAALAIMKNGKILMGKRKDNGKWTNPGGHVEEGEAPIHGAMREAKEEAGLDLSQDQLYHLDTKIVETPDGKKISVHGYKVNLHEGQTTIKNDPDDEVYRWHWVSLKKPLNKKIFDNLHVPLKDNVLLGAMEIKLEKKAFFVGFEKKANMSLNLSSGAGTRTGRFRGMFGKKVPLRETPEFKKELKELIKLEEQEAAGLRNQAGKVKGGFGKKASTRFMRESIKRISGGAGMRPKDLASRGRGKSMLQMGGENPYKTYHSKRNMFGKITSPENIKNKSVSDMYKSRTPVQKKKTLTRELRGK